MTYFSTIPIENVTAVFINLTELQGKWVDFYHIYMIASVSIHISGKYISDNLIYVINNE